MKAAKFQIIILFLAGLSACGEIVSYPDKPEIKFKAFNLFITKDILDNEILLGQLEMDFIDGNGDIGLNQPESDDIPDSLKYNLFLTLHEYKNGLLQKIEGDEGKFNYRIPFMERIGQNKTMKGTITIDIEYRTVEYDTIAYTFYLYDRDFNKSNTDTTRLISFTGSSIGE